MNKNTLLISLTLITFISCANADNKVEGSVQTTERIETQEQAVINKDVDVKEFKKLTTAKEGQILDVRTPKEWSEGIIEGAIKMNFYDNDFKTQLTKLDKDKPVYVYCKSGGRSGNAAKQMKKMGFKTIYNLDGGMSAWKAAEYPTVK